MQRYPSDVQASLNDFRQANWKAAISSCAGEGYPSMWRPLSNAAKAAIEDGKLPEGKVLWLLADACSMMLNPGSVNNPFKPFITTADGRSAIPEDFQPSGITLFAQIAEEIDDVWLKARLADLVWLLQSPRSHKYALLAIDAYRAIPLDAKTWVRGGRECWERAISLTLMLNTGAGNRLEELETAIITAFRATKNEDGFLAVWLADLLAANGLAKAKALGIASRLESLGRSVDFAANLELTRRCFGSSAKWFQGAGDETKRAEMTVAEAETWVKEAEVRLASEKPSHMVAASFYEKAIQTYRNIPRDKRAIHGVDERVAELHVRMKDSGEKSLGEMSVISSPSIDITALVQNARDAVKGKTVLEALAAFANIFGGARVARIRQACEIQLREHPLLALIPAVHRSSDGRVVAKQPGMTFGDTNSEEYQTTVWDAMVRSYSLELSLVAQGSIWPALEVIVSEHRLLETDFVSIASRSPIVPMGRAGLFGKALFAGYDKDLVTALHLLIPQIEHMVRWHLKAAGVKTTNLDQNGIENENGLSALMDLPETTRIFGEDRAFELKALFSDPLGPNLRNELAHGLLGEEECKSVYALYAWWLGLRLVFNTFWNEMRKADVETASTNNA
jgi:hypothetical protein